MKMCALTFSLFVCFLGSIAKPLPGQEATFWINPAGGKFATPEYWDNGAPEFNGQDLIFGGTRGDGNEVGLFTSVPEPGTAGLIGIALIGFALRRKRQPPTGKRFRFHNGLLAVMVIATVTSTTGIASADFVVNRRHSWGDFDVVAVFPGQFERRNVTNETMELTGDFNMTESFDAFVTDGFASGAYEHTDNVSNTGTQLSITSRSTLTGSAIQNGDAVASALINEFIQVDFSVVGGPANFSMTGNFNPTGTIDDQIFLTEIGGPDEFRYKTAQTFDITGTLETGDYTFRVFNGRLTNNNGPAFSGGHDFSLNIISVPEPGTLTMLGLIGTMVAMRRRRIR